jgi:hypothetical protein
MSDIEQVIVRTKKLEYLLRTQYHAEGRGLHQLISSCESRLPHELLPKLRYIATIRNKMLHEDGSRLDDRKQFLQQSDQCIKELTPRASRFIWRAAWSLLMAMTFGCLIFYYLNWEEFFERMFN